MKKQEQVLSSYRRPNHQEVYLEERNLEPIIENTCLGEDTSVSILVGKGAQTGQVVQYSEDVPPISNLSLMDIKKMQQENSVSIDNLTKIKEALELSAQEQIKPDSVEPLLKFENNSQPKSE